MKKRNLFIQTAVASALMAASVGAHAAMAVATPTVYATELFGPASATLVLQNAAATVYTMDSNRTIAGGTFQVRYTLTNAVFAVAPTTASLAIGAPGAAAVKAIRSGGAAGDNFIVFDVTPTGADMSTASTLTFAMPNLRGANALAAAATNIRVTIALTDLFGAFETAGNKAANVGVSAASLTGAIAATTENPNTAPDTGVIDAIAQNAIFFKTGSTLGQRTVRLGTINFTAVATSLQADGATARAKQATDTINVTVAGNLAAAVATTPTLSGLYLSTGANCTQTGAVNATTLTASGATFVAVSGTTTNTHLCMRVDGLLQIPATQITAAATYTPTSTTEVANVQAATNMLPLALNVVQKFSRNYIPLAVTGYAHTIKVTNTGAVATAITVTAVSEAGVAVGVPYVTPSVAPGASIRITQAMLENGIGATLFAATDRPRITLSAATGSIDVQSLVNTPTAGYSNVSGVE